jgi:hypothetical protein
MIFRCNSTIVIFGNIAVSLFYEQNHSLSNQLSNLLVVGVAVTNKFQTNKFYFSCVHALRPNLSMAYFFDDGQTTKDLPTKY